MLQREAVVRVLRFRQDQAGRARPTLGALVEQQAMGRPPVVDIVLQAVRVLCRILEGVLDAIDLVAPAKNLLAQRAVFLLRRTGIAVLALDLGKRWPTCAPPPRPRRPRPRGKARLFL